MDPRTHSRHPQMFSLHGKQHENMVDSGTAIHVCPSWYGLSPLRSSAEQLSLRSAGRDVLHHLGSKTESYVY